MTLSEWWCLTRKRSSVREHLRMEPDSRFKKMYRKLGNGQMFQIPGRVGDSPIPGAGAYANNFGGAAATGDGDVMMRFLPSFYTVLQMELGTKPSKATHKAIQRILDVYPKFSGAVVAMNSQGQTGVSCANINNFGYNVAYRNGTVITLKTQCLSVQKTFNKNMKYEYEKPIKFAS